MTETIKAFFADTTISSSDGHDFVVLESYIRGPGLLRHISAWPLSRPGQIRLCGVFSFDELGRLAKALADTASVATASDEIGGE